MKDDKGNNNDIQKSNDKDTEYELISNILREITSIKTLCDNFQKKLEQIAQQFQTTNNSDQTENRITQQSTPKRRRLKMISNKRNRTKEKKGKRKKKSIFGKIYRVNSILNGQKIKGYRVATKYMNVNHCIGPYATIEEATTVKHLIQKKLKEFNSNDPNVEENVKMRLNELKIEYDQKYPPLEMVRRVLSKKK